MNKLIDWKAFLIGVSIAGLIALLVMKFIGLNFWITFILVAFAMFINGLIAEWEDNRPGGFNNPSSAKKDKKSKGSEESKEESKGSE